MNRVLLVICFVFFATAACTKQEDVKTINLSGNKILAMGHGGMGVGSAYPLNSYEAILKCLNMGMDGSEFDVQMTKDSVLVAYHDLDLAANTNVKGTINSLSWFEIKNAYYTQTPYLNYSVSSLEQLFSRIENIQNYKFTFDCKLYTNSVTIKQFYNTYINSVINIIQKYNLENNVYIESQNEEFLTLFKNKKPNYKFFIYPTSFQSGLATALSLNLFGITIATKNITTEQIKMAHTNNVAVALWNVHTKSDNLEAIKKNPDFIQTDGVRSLAKLLQ